MYFSPDFYEYKLSLFWSGHFGLEMENKTDIYILYFYWKCSKSIFQSIQSTKENVRQCKETECSTPFVIKTTTSLYGLKFIRKAFTFFVAKLVDLRTL